MLTEPVDYDLDTHPITAGTGLWRYTGRSFWHATARQTPAFVWRNRFKIGGRTVEIAGFGLACIRVPFELFSLVSGASEIGEAIREGANSAKIYLVRQTLD
jgi:hypothetical protein